MYLYITPSPRLPAEYSLGGSGRRKSRCLDLNPALLKGRDLYRSCKGGWPCVVNRTFSWDCSGLLKEQIQRVISELFTLHIETIFRTLSLLHTSFSVNIDFCFWKLSVFWFFQKKKMLVIFSTSLLSRLLLITMLLNGSSQMWQQVFASVLLGCAYIAFCKSWFKSHQIFPKDMVKLQFINHFSGLMLLLQINIFIQTVTDKKSMASPWMAALFNPSNSGFLTNEQKNLTESNLMGL